MIETLRKIREELSKQLAEFESIDFLETESELQGDNIHSARAYLEDCIKELEAALRGGSH